MCCSFGAQLLSGVMIGGVCGVSLVVLNLESRVSFGCWLSLEAVVLLFRAAGFVGWDVALLQRLHNIRWSCGLVVVFVVLFVAAWSSHWQSFLHVESCLQYLYISIHALSLVYGTASCGTIAILGFGCAIRNDTTAPTTSQMPTDSNWRVERCLNCCRVFCFRVCAPIIRLNPRSKTELKLVGANWQSRSLGKTCKLLWLSTC